MITTAAPNRAIALARDVLLLTLGKYGQYVVTLLTLPIVSRTIGVHGAGLYGIGTAAYFIGTIVGDLGMSPIMGGRYAQASSSVDQGELRATFIALRTTAITLTAIIAMLVAVLIRNDIVNLITVGYIAGTLFSFGEDWVLVAQRKFARLVAYQAAGRAVYLCLTLGFIHMLPYPWWPVLCLGISNVLTEGLTWLWAGKVPLHRVTRRHLWSLARESAGPAAARLLTTGYGSGITLAYSAVLSPTALGIYSSSDRVVRAAAGAFDGLGTALLPRASTRFAASRDASFVVRRITAGAVLAGLFEGTVLWLTAPSIVALLYGPAFVQVTPVMRVMVALMPASSVSTVLTTSVLSAVADGKGIFIAAAIGASAGATGFLVSLAIHQSVWSIVSSVLASEVAVAVWVISRAFRVTTMTTTGTAA